MITEIFSFELRHWARQLLVHVYAFVLFLLSFGLIAEMGMEDGAEFNGRLLNSTSFLFSFCRRILLLLLLMLPAIFGGSVNRDWESGMHGILYAQPFGKWEYLAAKFGSSLFVFATLLFLLLLGFALGACMPWINPELFGPFRWLPYVQLYMLFLLPNAIILGSVVFAIVLLSRNVYAGYVAVLLLLIAGLLFAKLTEGGSEYLSALGDPLGVGAFVFESKYWTVAEQNASNFSWSGIILWNRLLWLAVSLGGLFLAGIRFQLGQEVDRSHRFLAFWGKGRRVNSVVAVANPLIPRNIFARGTTLVTPAVPLSFTLRDRLVNVYHVAAFHFGQILRSRLFLVLLLASLALLLLLMYNVNPRFGTEELPTSWRLLEGPAIFYGGLINAVTFLYAGLLLQTERRANTDQLVDGMATPDWVFLGGKYLALMMVQVCLLLLLMVSGVTTQLYKGFYDLNLGHYLFSLFGLSLVHFLIWGALAFFVQSVLQRPYLAFFLLLFVPIGFIGLAEFGPQYLGMPLLEQGWLRFNQGPGEIFGLLYSAMDGFGPALPAYFVYKAYWAVAALLLLVGSLLAWRRGYAGSRERLRKASQRLQGTTAYVFSGLLLAFLGFAAYLYHANNVAQDFYARPQGAKAVGEARKTYYRYRSKPQPRITSVDLTVDLYPGERRLAASGNYHLVNRTDLPQDTLLISYRGGTTLGYGFDRSFTTVSAATIADKGHFDVLLLDVPLAPGDSMLMDFTVSTPPATALHYNELVRSQGTFFNDGIFPRLGNWLDYLVDVRQGSPVAHRPLPTDTVALYGSTTSLDSDRIRFTAELSTSGDQRAITTGSLVDSWRENGRNHFRYTAREEIPHALLFLSGNYEVAQETWRGIPLEIYHEPGHDYNIDRMMAGARAALDYCADHFTPYQFDHARIVEFAQTGGSSAHGFPGTIPAGEGSCFLAALDGEDYPGSDYAFGTAAHEIAHQWWGNQLMPADVRGAKLLVESTAEYVSFCVKEAHEGKARVREAIRSGMSRYLRTRTNDRLGEQPLIHAFPTQNYLFYLKGAIALHTLGDYLGGNRLNDALAEYLRAVANQRGPYTTAPEMIGYLRRATPDSLSYLIKDGFETITLYDNAITEWSVTDLEDGSYHVEVAGKIRKYRSDETGTRGKDLPLADYLELGLFDAEGAEILVQRLRFDQEDFRVSFDCDAPPTRVELDPFYRFPEVERENNLRYR